jgi:hypothetical protein
MPDAGVIGGDDEATRGREGGVGLVGVGSPLVEQFRAGSAPVDLRLLAAQGALPLGPNDLVELLAHLTSDPEEPVRCASIKALSAFPADDLLPSLTDGGTHPSVLAWVLEFRTEDELRAAALQNKSTRNEAIETVAGSLPRSLAELVVINQDRLIHRRSLLEVLEANPNLENDQRRRLRELREEFFDKVEALPPAPVPVPVVEAPPVLEPPVEPEPVADADAAVRYLDETERNDGAKLGALQKLYRLPTAEKVITALKGTREERAILIRDPNRIVWSAVLSSPKVTAAEVEAFASMKNISDQALREIGSRREWTRHNGIAYSLVKNPRTPIEVALPLVPYLTAAQRKGLENDRNVSEAIRRAAKKGSGKH